MNFLIESMDRGFSVPKDMVSKGEKYLRRIAKKSSDIRNSSYAIYLLTRRGIVTTSYIASLEREIERNSSREYWKQDLASVYLAASYKMLKKDKKAYSLISDVSFGKFTDSYYYSYYSSLQRDSQLLYIISKYFPDRLSKVTGDDLKGIFDALNSMSYNSLSSASLVLALDAYSNSMGKLDLFDYSVMTTVDVNGEKREVPFDLTKGKHAKKKYNNNVTKFVIDNNEDFSLFFSVVQSGFDLKTPDKKIDSGIQIEKKYIDLNGNDIKKVNLGDEILVNIKIRSIDNKYHSDVAIVDLLPGGFDVVLDKKNGGSIAYKGTTLNSEFIEPREDRIIIYSRVNTSMTQFLYKIKAVNKGTFTTPPPFAEDMYDKTVKTMGTSGKIEIIGNK